MACSRIELRHHLAAQCISTHGADVHQEYVYQASLMNLEWSKDKKDTSIVRFYQVTR